jgi:hypothetical protein
MTDRIPLPTEIPAKPFGSPFAPEAERLDALAAALTDKAAQIARLLLGLTFEEMTDLASAIGVSGTKLVTWAHHKLDGTPLPEEPIIGRRI